MNKVTHMSTVGYGELYRHSLRLTDLRAAWFQYVMLFVCMDFFIRKLIKDKSQKLHRVSYSQGTAIRARRSCHD